MKTYRNLKIFKNKIAARMAMALFAVVFSMTAFTGYGQSFVLDLEYNSMSFSEDERTVLTDPGSNGGISQGAMHRYDNVITKDGITVYAKMTLLEVSNANIVDFDDDVNLGTKARFQPRIGSGPGGGYVLYKLEFFDADDDKQVFLKNYYVTGVDVDGDGSGTNKEYAEYSGFASYQLDATTELTVSTNNITGRTRFTGKVDGLSGITFENTASYIVNYSNPNNVITFAIGQTATNTVRYNSVQFGAAGGVFTNPQTTQNPLVIAVDDNGVPVSGFTGGTAVPNILDNDLYDGNPVVDGDVTISEITPASDAGVVLNTSTGEVSVAPGTPIGTYTIVYQICLNAAPDNCDLATIYVEVTGGSLTNYFPAGGYGTLAFEDLWPGKGDYDFNDLVLDYQFEIRSNLNNYVDTVIGTFIIKAFGAELENGFGFQLSDAISPADLTVTGYNLTEGYVTLDGNGTESGQSAPTIIVYDNAFNQMAHPGSGVGVNTTPGAPYVTPDTIRITIVFATDTYSYNQLDISNFNPFLIVDLIRGHEVHLPNYEPTDLADPTLFGTWEDDSDPLAGRYYKTENNLPWAIHIYETFDYPKEKKDIVQTHLKFADWASSGGILFPDWYQDNPGYRNTGNIFDIP